MRISDWSSDVCSSDLQHWGGIARAAALSTLLSIGAEMGSDSDNDIARAIRDGGQNTFNQAGQEIVRRQLNIQPTLTIRPGSPVRVLVSRDIEIGRASCRERVCQYV